LELRDGLGLLELRDGLGLLELSGGLGPRSRGSTQQHQGGTSSRAALRAVLERRGRASGVGTKDVLTQSPQNIGFVGSKPPEWTRWVLDLMGYQAGVDTVDDLFHGSGSVQEAIGQMDLLLDKGNY
jgi:hypothetical protein